VNVWRFGMFGPVIECVPFGGWTLSIADSGGAMSGNVPATDLVSIVVSIVGMPVPVLGDADGVNGNENQRDYQHG